MARKRDKKRCAYCDTEDVKLVRTKTKSKGFFKIFSIGTSDTFEESEMNCGICSRKYKAYFGTNRQYLQKHLQFSEMALGDLIRISPRSKIRKKLIDKVFNNVIAVAQIMSRNPLRKNDCDILFKFGKRRFYLHCKKKKRDFKVISVNEV